MNLSNELKVGLAILAAGAILFLGIRFFQGRSLFGGGYTLATRLVDSGGLAEGNPVTINGVQVGAVREVRLDPETKQVLVRFHVQEGTQIPEGTYAQVAGFGALGGVQLNLIPGPPQRPPVEPDAVIPSRGAGDVLDTFAHQALQISQSADTVLASTDKLLTRATRIMGQPSEGAVAQTLAATEQAAATLTQLLRAQEEALHRTLENTAALTADLKRFSSENNDSLDVAVDRLNRGLAELNTTLEMLQTTTQRVNRITAKINQGEGTLGRLINDPSLYAHLDSAAVRLNRILADLEENPGRYLDDVAFVELF